jgi:hypothetical protein
VEQKGAEAVSVLTTCERGSASQRKRQLNKHYMQMETLQWLYFLPSALAGSTAEGAVRNAWHLTVRMSCMLQAWQELYIHTFSFLGHRKG